MSSVRCFGTSNVFLHRYILVYLADQGITAWCWQLTPSSQQFIKNLTFFPGKIFLKGFFTYWCILKSCLFLDRNQIKTTKQQNINNKPSLFWQWKTKPFSFFFFIFFFLNSTRWIFSPNILTLNKEPISIQSHLKGKCSEQSKQP